MWASKKRFNYLTSFLVTLFSSLFSTVGLSQVKIELATKSSNKGYVGTNKATSDNDWELARYHRDKRERRRGRQRKKTFNIEDGAQRRPRSCEICKTIEGFVPMSAISSVVQAMVGKSFIFDKWRAVEIQKSRGVVETGLSPNFIGEADCPEIDSETWAIDYSHKRPWPALHKGIDIPQRHGTPILAVASGTVVGKFKNKGNRKGIEVMIRHSPKQTGLPFWTYSQYTHLLSMSPLTIGQSVKIGQEVGKTSNSGKMGRRLRRDALHFAILYSKQSAWSNDGRFVAPKDGYWMDPNAFYKIDPPFDSHSVVKLPEGQKGVSVPYAKTDGTLVPPSTQRIWPYPCSQ